MREVLTELVERWRAGDTIGLATVVGTVRSAPRPAGAAMLVLPDGTASGSVSGGCVEGAVYGLAEEVVADGRARLQRYGFSDDEAFAVGLTCGGIIDVFVEPVSTATFPELGGLADDIEGGRPVALATVIDHPDPTWLGRRLVVRPDDTKGSLGLPRADAAIADDARGLLAAGSTTVLTYGPAGERMDTGMRVFVASFQPPPRMIVFGAIDFAAAVARQGKLLGYHVTVCDARPVFATRARFREADEVVVSWPHHYLEREAGADRIDRRTVVCVLTHDPKFDVPVLSLALRLDGDRRPAFVGAMGSRRTHETRWERLREAGLTEDQLARLSSPIGLDLGGRTPEETAVSVAAEIIALRWGGTGDRLTETGTRVHHDPSVGTAQ
ncbi:putative xanthine dehydrogenase accessory factor [Aeromicrobium marinum DSM 15272]|uniref:Xanthine dehydrogenase accessory factor n=1 Tax=Aeromicrobium marinum DSM 15272 TaxID=585531 RepID=E2SDE2_9ACTN|nr:XdhC/CoxI family protein [Aeromicrobium marinum]EFQ82519.1 putative xanthine dehydrogenase accessory factor [Aeromicrobium marinum DSM 15272]